MKRDIVPIAMIFGGWKLLIMYVWYVSLRFHELISVIGRTKSVGKGWTIILRREMDSMRRGIEL